MERSWCPSLSSDGVQLDKKHFYLCGSAAKSVKSATAKDYSAVAANSDKSAHAVATQVPKTVRKNYRNFDSAIVASNKNKSKWPSGLTESPFSGEVAVGGGDGIPEVVSYSSVFLSEQVTDTTPLPAIRLPADELTKFIDYVARFEAKIKSSTTSSNMKNIHLSPSLARSVAFDELITSIDQNPNMRSAIKSFAVEGSNVVDVEKVAKFFASAQNLNAVSVSKCSFQNASAEVFRSLKESSVEHLLLESNDLGLQVDPEAAEESVTALSELLKHSKFIVSLNLAYNNYSHEGLEALLDALYESDTKMLPEDFPLEEKEETPAADYIETEVFLGDGSEEEEEDEDDASTESEPEEENEAEAEENEEEQDAMREDDEKDSQDDDDEDAGEENEEGEEDEEADDVEDDADDEEEEGEEDEEDEESEAYQRAKYLKEKLLRKSMRAKRKFFKEESAGRLEVTRAYIGDLLPVAMEIEAIRERQRQEDQKKLEEFCKRRSGWSHLRNLILRGNTVNDATAAKVAMILKDEIDLGEEEAERIEGEMRDKVTNLVESTQRAREEAIQLEAKERRALLKECARGLKALQIKTLPKEESPNGSPLVEEDEEEENEEDEYETTAPEVLMTNVEEDEEEEAEAEAEEEEDEELEVSPEDMEWEEEAAALDIPMLPTKSGMNTITFLDLGGCELTSRGLSRLASSLKTNKVLETLVLRSNTFTFRPKQEEGGDAAAKSQLVEVPPGFAALVEVLSSNTTLKHLDFGFCQLHPASLFLLATALQQPTSCIVSLNLEGNHFQSPEASNNHHDIIGRNPTTPLYALLQAIAASGVLQDLNLSNNNLEDVLWQEELNMLAAVSTKLAVFSLSNVGLRGEHLSRWCDALGGASISLRILNLSRNNFVVAGEGHHIGRLLAKCSNLVELSLDNHPKLGSEGVATALASLSTPLKWLSCNETGLTSTTAPVGKETLPTIPISLMNSLEYLSLSDLHIDSIEQLEEWSSFVHDNASSIRYLSLWSRKVDMETSLAPLVKIVEGLGNLLHTDFGVLLRFDYDQDISDQLGDMERVLVKRRVAHACPNPEPVACPNPEPVTNII